MSAPDDGHLLSCAINFDETWSCDPTCPRSAPRIVVENVHIDPPPPRTPHPCEVGRHRWAWLVDGRQACGYCGRPR